MLKLLKLPLGLSGTSDSPSGRRKEPVIAEAATLTSLPAAIQDEPVVVKLLFLWLPPQASSLPSQRAIARALGVSQGAVSLSLAKLRTLGLGGGKKAPRQASSSEPAATALPKALLAEHPTTKLVYLYLRPYRELEVSVRGLEALLGVSHRPTAEAMQRLTALKLLEVLRPPSNSPGRYSLATT